jgi:hypothetical protein
LRQAVVKTPENRDSAQHAPLDVPVILRRRVAQAAMKGDNARDLGTTARKLQYGGPSKAESNGSDLARKKPAKTVRGQNVQRQQVPDSHSSRESGNQGAQPNARSSSSPRGFWDYSW